MAPKRLLVVRPSLTTGGADRVTLTLLRTLDRSRFAPSLVLLREPGPLLPELPDDVPVEVLRARNILSAVPHLRRLVERDRPDILFSTSSGTNITAALAVGRHRPRLVLSERNGLVRDQPFYKLWPLLLLKRASYRRADRVIAVSEGVASDLRRRLRLDEAKVAVTYNPVVTPELDRLAEAPVAEPWFEENAPVVLAAGRFVRAKGFDLLLDAVARVRPEFDCRLVILGDGPLRDRLLSQAASLGLAGVCKAPGFVNNPYAYMRRATVFALPSRFEGLPGVLIQAMACGCAVVATDCRFGPREIVTTGRDGMLVPPEDPARLALELSRLLSQPQTRGEIGRAARRSAQRFTTETVMPRYLQALDPQP
jgi:glycosyltransferase involved in cell wall biosynthesis